MGNEEEVNIGFQDKTGVLMMLDKKQRKLLKEILMNALKSDSALSYIENKLGKQYIEVGKELLKNLGSSDV